jgi:rhomboid protease GluP
VAELVEIGSFGTVEGAERHALVLAAVGIGCRLALGGRGRGGVGLLVAPAEAERARREIALFERENRPVPRRPVATPPAVHGADAALAYCAVLVSLFVADHRHLGSVDWRALGAVQAGLMRDGGEWWRAVTALCLHADLGHLAGNLAAGAGLGLLVARILGWGLGWLAVLLAGVLGNALNAALQPDAHAAVGASTAVFGALGLLSGHARRSRTVPWRGGLRRWAPVAAGVMLLAFLGTGGERTDVGAHVAGFAAGWATGFALAHASGHLPTGAAAQRAYGGAAACLLTLAWLLALLRGAA